MSAGVTQTSRAADSTVIWRTYVANRDEVCRGLEIPFSPSDEIEINRHDVGIEIIVKSVGDRR